MTGGAGFIGSNFVDKFLLDNNTVHVLDNLSAGNPRYIENWKKFGNFKFLKIDLIEKKMLDSLDYYDLIYHAAADPEVRPTISNPKTHFNQNILATFNLLEAFKEKPPEKFVFMSTSTVYGDATIPTPENYAYMEPISSYGASKLACESLLSSYAHSYGFKATIFRLANIIGEQSTHGVIFDFLKKLTKHPNSLEILGDGTQKKSYLYISDCFDAFQFGLAQSSDSYQIFNVGSSDRVDVKTIAKVVIEEMSLEDVKITFSGGVDGGRGWKGDVKNMLLDITKLKTLGWKPKYNSLEAVKITTNKIVSKNQKVSD